MYTSNVKNKNIWFIYNLVIVHVPCEFHSPFQKRSQTTCKKEHMVCVRLASTLYYNTNLCARAQCKSITFIHSLDIVITKKI